MEEHEGKNFPPIILDENSLKHYASEVKKRLDYEKEKKSEEKFLRTSLRASSKLRAIEKYRKTVQQESNKNCIEINLAFENDQFEDNANSG